MKKVNFIFAFVLSLAFVTTSLAHASDYSGEWKGILNYQDNGRHLITCGPVSIVVIQQREKLGVQLSTIDCGEIHEEGRVLVFDIRGQELWEGPNWVGNITDSQLRFAWYKPGVYFRNYVLQPTSHKDQIDFTRDGYEGNLIFIIKGQLAKSASRK